MISSSLITSRSCRLSALTATGDHLALFGTSEVVDLGVRVVEDGPACVVLHGVTVTVVVHCAAPAGLTTQVFRQ